MEDQTIDIMQWVSMAITLLLTVAVAYGKHYIKSSIMELKAEIISHITSEVKIATDETRKGFVSNPVFEVTQQLWTNQIESLQKDVDALKNDS